MKWYFARSPGKQTMCGRDLQTVTRGWSKKTKTHRAFFWAFLEDMWQRVAWGRGRRDGRGGGGEGGSPFHSLQGHVAEEVRHRLAVVGSPDRLRQDHGDVDDLEGKQSLVSPYCNITIMILPFCRYDIYCMSIPLPPDVSTCYCKHLLPAKPALQKLQVGTVAGKSSLAKKKMKYTPVWHLEAPPDILCILRADHSVGR